MVNKFRKTVDLKEQAERQQAAKQSKVSRAAGIDRIYNEKEEARTDMQKIQKPVQKQVNEELFKRIVVLVAIIIVVGVSYFMFFKKSEDNGKAKNWYSIKLVNNEIFYGQIKDTGADPVVIKNVYYIYDQQKDEGKAVAETGNLRLVKRGKETHGPEGTMNVVRVQVLYMEPLKDDSKVLEAILSYER